MTRGRDPAGAVRMLFQSCVLPLLRGGGQMLFQPSARTGLLFLILIGSQSGASLLACLAGLLGASLCAYALEHPDRDYFDGAGGFNGGLLGLALSVLYDFNGALVVSAFAGGAATGLLRWTLRRLLPVPPFTAPFVAVGWLVLALGGFPGLALSPAAAPVASVDCGQACAVVTNASEVLFIADPHVGALVFLAVLLHSVSAAWRIAAASVMAWVTTVLFALPGDLAAAGLLGYNALILAAALKGRRLSRFFATGGVVASVLLSHAFFAAQWNPLSAPFVLSAWLLLGLEAMMTRHRAARR